MSKQVCPTGQVPPQVGGAERLHVVPGSVVVVGPIDVVVVVVGGATTLAGVQSIPAFTTRTLPEAN